MLSEIRKGLPEFDVRHLGGIAYEARRTDSRGVLIHLPFFVTKDKAPDEIVRLIKEAWETKDA